MNSEQNQENSGQTLLALSTSSSQISVALWYQGECAQQVYQKKGPSGGEDLALKVRALLNSRGCEGKEVSFLMVDKGPGSFTGIRVGVSLANALALGWNIAVAGVSSLDLIATRYCQDSGKEGAFTTAIYAGRGEVYAADYKSENGDWHKEKEDCLLTKEALFLKQIDRVIVGWRLDQVDLQVEEQVPGAVACFSLLQRGCVDFSEFVLPHYVRIPDAVPGKQFS